MFRKPLLSLLFLWSALWVHAQEAWRPDEVLLLLRKEARADEVRTALQGLLPNAVGLKAMTALGRDSRYFLVQLNGAGIDEAEVEGRLAQAPGVEATSLNYLLEYRAQPNDALYATQWSMAAIDVEQVWNTTTGGSMTNGRRIAVGIVDGLVQTTHPDLADNISPLSPYTGEGAEHGTMVAGVVGATGNNGIGVTGVNWDVDLVPLGHEFGGSLAGAISGFGGALILREDFTNSAGADGALVVAVTVSWGFLGMSCEFGYAIFEDMADAGILAITAAPNDPVDTDDIPDFPSGCPNSNNIAVTCIGPDGENPFAVGNSTLHLQAPGIAIPTTAVGGAYDVQDGNSFAVPHVAGAVALLYSAPCPSFAHLVMTDPPAAAQLVKSAILQGGELVPGGDTITITGRTLNVLGAYEILMGQCVQTCTDLTITFTPTDGTVAEALLTGPQGNAMATASGPVLQGCFEAGCYQAAFNAAGGAPIGGTWVVTDGDAGVVANGSSVDGQFTFSFGDIVSGCTTPNSGNFNPAANCNDGSCCPGDIVRVKVLAEDLVSEGTAQVEIVVGGSVVFDGAVSIEFGFDPELGDDLAVGTVQVCAPDGCMNITVTDGTIPLQEEAYVTVGDDDPSAFLLSEGHLGPVGDAPTPELCDGLDNDCDGLVDEDFLWFVDADGDGFGSTISLGVQCTQPPNAVADSSDCDDADPAIHTVVTLFVLTEDGNDSGTAHYVLEQGGEVVEGDMDLLAADFGLGQAPLCVGDGCYSISITQNDVPLYPESFLVHNFGTVEELVFPFGTEAGYQSEGSPETCDGIDNDCDAIVDEDCGATLAARVFLEGPYDPGTGLMNDGMRALGLVPTTEPYTGLGYTHVGGGGETTTPAVLAASGNDAIVDWVVLELRDALNPSIIVATRSALLQRDGDVVDTDGINAVSFSIGTGDYMIAVRHRNHLGCMMADAVLLSSSATVADLTLSATTTFGTSARKTSGGAISVQLLWAGDVTFNHVVKYTGSGNDRDPILVTVGNTTPNNSVTTYSTRDVNLNGQVKYTGSGNDRDPVLVNVGNTTPNNTRTEQLP